VLDDTRLVCLDLLGSFSLSSAKDAVHCCPLLSVDALEDPHLLYCRLKLHLQDVLQSTLARQVQPSLQFAMLTGSQEAENMHVVQMSRVLTWSCGRG
jgi:hypothetical protein